MVGAERLTSYVLLSSRTTGISRLHRFWYFSYSGQIAFIFDDV